MLQKDGKKIILCVSGGIAVYKVCELVRLLRKSNYQVKVIMTKNAMEFVTPTTFEVLSNNEVFTSVFPAEKRKDTYHIELARWADLILVAPATANIIGKIANGIADDILTTTLIGAKAKVIVAPAMNDFMYENLALQTNLEKLKSFGYKIIPPCFGDLACGVFSVGRLAEPEQIFQEVENYFEVSQSLKGKKILITAGPTKEPIDAVRFISNPSSGKMGYAIAEKAIEMGAEVTLVSGEVSISPPPKAKLINVKTAREMFEATMRNHKNCEIAIFTAAVGDYTPKNPSAKKLKKISDTLTLELVKTKDIAFEAGKLKGKRIHIGFAVETENELENAKIKLLNKNFDFVVLNNPKEKGAAFQCDTNKVTLVFSNKTEPLPLMSKKELAQKILQRIKKF